MYLCVFSFFLLGTLHPKPGTHNGIGGNENPMNEDGDEHASQKGDENGQVILPDIEGEFAVYHLLDGDMEDENGQRHAADFHQDIGY